MIGNSPDLDVLLEQDKIKNLVIKLLNPGYFELEDPWEAAKKIYRWEPPMLAGSHKTIEFQSFRPPAPICKAFGKLTDILWDHEACFLGVYVHGSYATGSYVEASDLDMLYIMSEHGLDPYRLLALREILSKTKEIFEEIDPGDHHGPYIMLPQFLNNYIESYLPLEAWKKAKCVFGRNELLFDVQKSEYHEKEWFEKSGPFYKDAAEHPERFQTFNAIKKFCLMATMIPAVAYPWVTGEYTTKQIALEWVRATYPSAVPWADELTRMRAENDFTKAPLNESLSVWKTIKGG